MPDALLNDLPPPVRLALTYAPAAQRPVFTAMFALDHRLARQVRQASEPMLGQVRLAWWRERLAQLPQVPAGEPLLAACAAAGLRGEHGEALLDGWERVLLAEDEREALAGFNAARAGLFAGLARANGFGGLTDRAALAGQRWACAELVLHGGDSDAGRWAGDELKKLTGSYSKLPRALRTLAMLEGWALSVARRGDKSPRSGWKDLSVMLRIGLFG